MKSGVRLLRRGCTSLLEIFNQPYYSRMFDAIDSNFRSKPQLVLIYFLVKRNSAQYEI